MRHRAWGALGARVTLAAMTGLVAPAASFGAEIGSVCVRQFSAGIDCSGSDVAITAITPVTLLEGCAAGDPTTAEAVFELTISAGAQSRYDIGLFLALNGDSALSGGTCLHDYLEPPLDSSPTYGDADMNGRPDLAGGPWWNGEPFVPADDCGDIEAGTDDLKTLAALRLDCVDDNGDGSVDLSTCTSWSASTSSTCSGLSAAAPGSGTRCACNRLETGIPMPGAVVASGEVGSLGLAPDGSGGLLLSWPASCSANDTDYIIYEGALGDFASHQSVACSTGGATSATIQPRSGDAYYLVVPRNAQREGSYGMNGAGAERPVAIDACLPRLTQACF